MNHLIELLLAMPGFAFGFGFGPQGGKSTVQGTSPVATGDGHVDFSHTTAIDTALLAIFEDI